MRQALKEGLIHAEYLGHQIGEADHAGVISKREASELQNYHDKVVSLLAVDDFAPGELIRSTSDTTPAPITARKTAPRKKSASKKKTGKKKASKKKANTKKTQAMSDDDTTRTDP